MEPGRRTGGDGRPCDVTGIIDCQGSVVWLAAGTETGDRRRNSVRKEKSHACEKTLPYHGDASHLPVLVNGVGPDHVVQSRWGRDLGHLPVRKDESCLI